MLHADVSQNRQKRIHDVGAVQTAAHAGFQHRHLNRLLEKPLERHRRGQFEKRARTPPGQGGLPFIRALGFVQQAQQIRIRNGFTAHADPLAKTNDMGTGVKSGAESGFPQGRFHHGGDGSLSVGAGHMNARQGQRIHAHGPQQGQGGVQPELDRFSACPAVEIGQLGIQDGGMPAHERIRSVSCRIAVSALKAARRAARREPKDRRTNPAVRPDAP